MVLCCKKDNGVAPPPPKEFLSPEPEGVSLRTKLKDKILEVGENTTSHAIPNIIRSDDVSVKILWTIFFFISFGYCLYTIFNSLILFLQYETVIQMDIQRVTLTEFPAVTICNANPFNMKNDTVEFLNSILIENNLTEAINITDYYNLLTGNVSEKSYGDSYGTGDNEFLVALQQFLSGSAPPTDELGKSGEENVDPLISLKAHFETSNTFVVMEKILDLLRRTVVAELNEPERKPLGMDLSDMLLSCSYNREDCTTSNFSSFWNYKYGNCYTINGKDLEQPPLNTSQSGSSNGLHMELYIGDIRTPVRFSTSQGIYLIVHNYTTDPMLLDDGLFLATGFQTYISVSRTFSTTLPAPYSTCISDLTTPASVYGSKLFGYMESLNVSDYSQSFCYKLCYQDHAVATCGCADATISRIGNSRYCVSPDELTCLDNLFITYSQSDLETFCESGCPQQCETIMYTVNNFLSNYPSDYYIDLLSPKFPFIESDSIESYLKKSVLKVIINYGDLYYTTVDESPAMTVEDILGNVGGQLGLFIGVSVLSFVELIELSLELIVITYDHYKGKKFAG